MFKNIKSNKGITLIALSITIIVIIILAAVIIRTTIGENGFLNKAEKDRDTYENSTQREEDKIKDLEDELNKGGPVLNFNLRTTSSTITVSRVSLIDYTGDASSVTFKYAIGRTESTIGSEQTNKEFTGLNKESKYYIKVVAYDGSGNVITSKIREAVTVDFIPGTLEFTLASGTKYIEGEWVNESVKVKLKEGSADATTSYSSTDGKISNVTGDSTIVTEGDYTIVVTATNGIETVQGDNYSVRIDKTPPTNTKPEVTATDNSITVTFKQTDTLSGIPNDVDHRQYRLTNASGTSTGGWRTSNVFTGLTSGQTYYVQTKAIDRAGNEQLSQIEQIQMPTKVYAKLYDTDGDGKGETLVFGATQDFTYTGTLKNDYGDVTDIGISNPKWYNQKAYITEVDILDEIFPESTCNWFYGNTKLTTINNISNLNTNNVKNMKDMFYNCYSLTSLDLSSFDTSKVMNMYGMFYHCESLTSLDVSKFDTSNVIDMGYMFSGCNNLTSLDVTGFDTSKVTSMSYMFSYCSKLTSLDVTGFDTSKVTYMDNMFYYCSELTSLDVSNFDTSKVTNMSHMFSACSKLTSLDVSNFDTSNVTDMSHMFSACSKLTSLDVSNFDTSNVIAMYRMFFVCSNLTSQIKITGNKCTNYTNMFYNATTNSGAQITVYSDGTNESLVQNMIATKSSNSNVVYGGVKN